MEAIEFEIQAVQEAEQNAAGGGVLPFSDDTGAEASPANEGVEVLSHAGGAPPVSALRGELSSSSFETVTSSGGDSDTSSLAEGEDPVSAERLG